MCIDVTVKRGAECNTDHNTVCMKLRRGHHMGRQPKELRIEGMMQRG